MKCWHCNNELEFSYQTADLVTKVYECKSCGSWYELRKEKARLNAAVPVLMSEIESPKELAYPRAA